MSKQKRYKARWHNAVDLKTNGDVDFDAQSDYHAKLRADKIAKEIGRTNSPRVITCGSRVVESINTGVSK